MTIKLILTSAGLFVVGAVFFEVLINMTGRSNFDDGISGFVFPAILVGIGFVMLMTRQKTRLSNPSKDQTRKNENHA